MQIKTKLLLFAIMLSAPFSKILAQIGATNPPSGIGATNASFCQGASSFGTIKDIFNFFTCLILDSVVPLLITIAIVIFIWGVIQYVINADDVTKRAEGRNFMIWGIIGLFAIVSVWGLIKILTGTFGVNFVIPQLQQ